MGFNNAIKIDVASVKALFQDVQDNDHNGILSAGDLIGDGSFDFQSGYELKPGDVASLDSLTQSITEHSGRMVRVLKGAGLFAKNAYLAVSYSDSTEVEMLVKIGQSVLGVKMDTPDSLLDLSRASHQVREHSHPEMGPTGGFIPSEILEKLDPTGSNPESSTTGASSYKDYKHTERLRKKYDKFADNKNTAREVLMTNWYYLDRDSLRATGAALVKIKTSQNRMDQLEKRINR